MNKLFFLAVSCVALMCSCINDAENHYLPTTISKCLGSLPKTKAVPDSVFYYYLIDNNNNVTVSFYQGVGCDDKYGTSCDVKNDTARITVQHIGNNYTLCSCKKLFTVQLPCKESDFSVMVINNYVSTRSNNPLPSTE